MKFILSFIVAAVISAGPVQTGAEAPLFEKADLGGKTVSLESYRGDKTVLLVFSRYIGCSWCQMFMVDLLKHSDEFAAANAEVIIVTSSDAQTAGRYEPPQKFPFILLPDPDMDLYKLYGVKMKGKSFTWNVFKQSALFLGYLSKYDWVKNGLAGDHYQPPACFVIDKSGVVKFVHVGRDVADNPDAGKLVEVVQSLK